ncbi:DUF952 domain-containing protein [Hyphomonas sp.]|uniref:DUF952 domain-containing protein n=1 Tax=Hyphomonas sp. TaxID=87 RepID=UPI003919D2EF
MQPVPVYKLLTAAEWQEAEAIGVTATALDTADGYVHLSAAGQLAETARRHFAGKGSVRLLRFDASALDHLRWEASRNGELFPHVYGPLRVSDAELSVWLDPGPDGVLLIPEDVV